ncbi:MAG: hypothetical protein ABJB01_03625 [Rudaea sp.]
MKMYTWAIVALLLTTLAHADGDVRKTGTMKIDSGAERPTTLHVGCSSDPDGGALVIELTVADAYTKKDFGYDDFEGPDAHAGALSRLDWITAARTTSITTTASGSYIPEPPDAFQFGIDARSRQPSKGATLLAAFGDQPGKLVWTQSSDDKSRRTLIATFDFDASETKRVHDVTSACQPKTK